jgi:hypothetical protein
LKFSEIFKNFNIYNLELNKIKHLDNILFEKECAKKALQLFTELDSELFGKFDVIRLIRCIKDYFLALNGYSIKTLIRIDQVASALQI